MQSPLRTEIEKWVKKDGLNPLAAAGRLIEEHGGKISHQSIWNHMQEHFDIKAERPEAVSEEPITDRPLRQVT